MVWSRVIIASSLFHNWSKLAQPVPGTPSHYLKCISIGNCLCSPWGEVMVPDFSSLLCRLPYSEVFTLSLPRCCTFVGGVFTHFAETRQCARRWGLRENPLPGATKQTREEMNTSPFFFLFPPLPFTPAPPTPPPHTHTHPFFSLSHPRQQTDNPKGHLWPPALAPPVCVSSTLRRKGNEKHQREFQFGSPRAGHCGSHKSIFLFT